jgi:hypothetical protein
MTKVRISPGGIAQAALVVLVVTGLATCWQSERQRADVAERNLEAALDSVTVFRLRSAQWASERLALEGEVRGKDAALKELERRYHARTESLARVRMERDALATRLQRLEDRDSVAVFSRDTAGIHAEVTISPAPPAETTVDLTLEFAPSELAIALLRDPEGRARLVAWADSLHRVRIEGMPIVPPTQRTRRWGTGCGLGIGAVGTSFGVGAVCGVVLRLP